MKKAVACILVCVYFFATAGMNIAMHFCMGDVVSVTLGYSEEEACASCHMEKNTDADAADHCCKDEHQFFKVSIDHETPMFAFSSKMPIAIISIFLSDVNKKADRDYLPLAVSPPLNTPDVPVFQRNCNFRI